MTDDKDAEFAFDLFSDIAPLLALFGDQFARQFASESLTWVDHLIFAMVPLGILTAITGAIRVQGPRIAKSFIGRGRENRALAEIELMSSTSKEVCELFNGKSIIRVMGKPRITQILIFPQEYKTLKDIYEKADLGRLRTPSKDQPREDDKPTEDNSCGIHTFKSAATSTTELLKFEDYHSYSYQIISRIADRLISSKKSSSTDAPPGHNDFEWLGPPNLQLGLSSDQFEKGFPKKGHEVFMAALAAILLQASLIAIATITVWHGPTRRAISFEPKNYGYPCYITGSVLLSMGIAVCSLAVERNTIEYNWRVQARDKSGQEPAQKTTPASESEIDVGDSPRLLWLQKSQEVNDQSFNGYAILAGPKHHIITSSRIEDAGTLFDPSDELSSRSRFQPDISKGAEGVDNGMKPVMHSHLSQQVWEIITVFAVIAAGTGFIIQFMGLRGLTYPCSIAQLVAILLMALVRAIIRRRLGRKPAHCPAFTRFEIDFLATRIVYSRIFRDYHKGIEKQIPHLNKQRPKEYLCWKVKTAKPNDDHPFLSSTLQDLRTIYSSNGGQHILIDRSELLHDEPDPLQRSQELSTTKESAEILAIEEASSQQLLRVRERLGDLCKWHSESLESAQALAYSVEAFMDSFFPKRMDSLDWVIETIGVSTERGIGRPDFVTVSVKRSSRNGRWQVDIGKIDAVLSLWMASIEVEAADIRKNTNSHKVDKKPGRPSSPPNWRRTKAGVDLRYNFCRILGDDFDDGSLKRDLSWWVDEIIADQSDASNNLDTGLSGGMTGNKKLPDLGQIDQEFARGAGKEQTRSDQWRCSSARVGAVDLIIGFNGRNGDFDGRRKSATSHARELAVTSSGLLPTIIAQHLFTGFMWTVVDQLPDDCLRRNEQDIEIDGRHTFDPHEFGETWHRPTLRHRQLTKLVRDLEKYGLGSYLDILLCMIPALSVRDLLPNHAILRLIPSMRQDRGWVATARSYNKLLGTSIRTTPEEAFCYSVVVAALDFLHFACEPYDDFIRPPTELVEELEGLVRRLSSPAFAPILVKLAPLCIIQHRRQQFERIFARYGEFTLRAGLADNDQSKDSADFEESIYDGCNIFSDPHPKLDLEFAITKLGLSRRYKDIYIVLELEAMSPPLLAHFPVTLRERMERPFPFKPSGPEPKGVDIFGWSPLHYAALLADYEVLEWIFKPSLVKENTPLHQVYDKIERSPIHVAVAVGGRYNFSWALECLGEEDRKNALNASGLDRMTPLHLATKSGSLELIRAMIHREAIQTVRQPDFWGREAIHLAASCGQDEISSLLLKEGSQPFSVDSFGLTPLNYLLKGDADLKVVLDSTDTAKTSEVLNTDPLLGSLLEPYNEQTLTEVDETSVEARDRTTKKRKMFIEFALKRVDFHDKEGRSFLHHAVQYADLGTVQLLLSKGYQLEQTDSQGRSPLHLAILAGRTKIALSLLEGVNGFSANRAAKDKQKETPLMLAARGGHLDIVRYLINDRGSEVKEQDQERTMPESKPVDSSELLDAEANKDCNPLARNVMGRTALHIALSFQSDEVALYLLRRTPVENSPKDEEGETVLVTAVRSRSSPECVRAILDKWPGIVNDPDMRWDQTPLSWACERGYEDIMKVLLEHKRIDVNKPAERWRKYTPLHFAIAEYDTDILNLLLAHPDIDIEAKDARNDKPLDTAIRESNEEMVQAFLVHPTISKHMRIDYLKRFCTHRYVEMHDIVPKIFDEVQNEGLSDTDLIELIKRSEDLRDAIPYETFLQCAFSRNTWKKLESPMHAVARLGSLRLMEAVQAEGIASGDLDSDNWSCVDYTKTYKLDKLDDKILQFVSEHTPADQPKRDFNVPGLLELSHLTDCVSLSGCTKPKHNGCAGVNVIEVMKERENWRASFRTKNPIPPVTAKRKGFYYEVTVLEDSKSKMFGIGFCDKRYDTNQMPGWYDISFGYHGDDGNLFLNFGERGVNPTPDFGPQGTYGAGDTVGIGLNMETGEGFVTLNGKKQDIGDAFNGVKYNGRKMYPCVGFDTTKDGVGLRFDMNLGCPQTHPFKYTGDLPW